MSILDQIAAKIIKEQELVIGPLAWSEASKVQGLQVINAQKAEVFIAPDLNPKQIVDKLVNQYERLFGKASREVCREAVRNIISTMPEEEIPDSLKK
jgi:hypothetical protein